MKSIIKYSEKLGIKLFPAQAFVLKLAYGIPLSRERRIEFQDPTSGKDYSLTEPDYLKSLHDRGRSNISAQQAPSMVNMAVMGRRSGKNTLLGLSCTHAVQHLLRMEDPHSRYGIPCGAIGVSFFGVDRDEAAFVMNDFNHEVRRDGVLRGYCSSQIDARVTFRTPADLQHRGLNPDPAEGLASRMVTFVAKSSAAKGFRGRAHFHVAMSEMAYWREPREIWDTVLPSLMQYTPKDTTGAVTGWPESKVLNFSTGREKSGHFYNLCTLAHGLVLRIPTWEMNPSLPQAFYREEMRRNPRFGVEFGADFGDALSIAS